MPTPKQYRSVKPWFKKRLPNNKTYENVANIDDKPVSGYYGFKLYFPVLGIPVTFTFKIHF